MQWSRSATRALAMVALVVILLSSGAIVGLFVGYSHTLLHILNLGDFYIYITLCALVGLWSIFGLYVVYKDSLPGIRNYLMGHILLCVFQFVLGLIHVIVLFALYRPRFMDACFGTDPSHLFWWSLGYDQDVKLEQTRIRCVEAWVNLAILRSITWLVYTMILIIMTLLIQRYHRVLVKSAVRQSVEEEPEAWPDQDQKPQEKPQEEPAAEMFKTKLPSPPPAYRQQEQIKLETQEQNEMRDQRDRLFEEIYRRRQQCPPKTPPSTCDTEVHPLDHSQAASMQHATLPLKSSPSHRYTLVCNSHSPSYTVHPASSEKIDYDRFRSNHREEHATQLSGHSDDNPLLSDPRAHSRRRKTRWRTEQVSEDTASIAEAETMLHKIPGDKHDNGDDEREPMLSENDDDSKPLEKECL